MEHISQTKRQPAKQEFIMLVLGCTSLFIAAVGIIMTDLGTMMLSAFVGLGFIMGVRRLARRISYKQYEQQRQRETRAHRMASAARGTGAGKPRETKRRELYENGHVESSGNRIRKPSWATWRLLVNASVTACRRRVR